MALDAIRAHPGVSMKAGAAKRLVESDYFFFGAGLGVGGDLWCGATGTGFGPGLG